MDIEISKLTPHPKNSDLYDSPSTEDAEWNEFLTSIKVSGILEPILITSTYTILSGHRRWSAALSLGLVTIPCIILAQMNEQEELRTIVDANRYRKKKLHEIRHEAELLESLEREAAKQRKVASGKGNEPDTEKGRSAEKIAKSLGIGSHVTYDRLRKIWDVADSEPAIAQALKEVDDGKKSLNSVWKMTQKVLYPDMGEDGIGFDLQVYDKWLFGENHPTIGQKHPGRLPGQLLQNVLHYWTEPGNMVVDPFGGGGITIDACESMERRYMVYDIAPVRKDIMQWDISKGFPEEAYGCDLIFLDPPYWNMLDTAYLELSKDSCAGLSFQDFHAFLNKLVVDAFLTIRSGGHICLIIMPQRSKLPRGVEFCDWPYHVEKYMEYAGFTIVNHVVEQWPTSIYTPYDVSIAKGNKKMLQITGSMIIGRKP